jgi:hypothetical protein
MQNVIEMKRMSVLRDRSENRWNVALSRRATESPCEGVVAYDGEAYDGRPPSYRPLIWTVNPTIGLISPSDQSCEICLRHRPFQSQSKFGFFPCQSASSSVVNNIFRDCRARDKFAQERSGQ